MTKLSATKRICITAVCIALCCVLPMAFHGLGLGSVFSPMHIPVLLCGLTCGGVSGLVCGALGPVLSSVLSGMPKTVGLISMVPELAVYGLAAGLLMGWVRTGKLFGDLYISLTAAMLLGRLVGGAASALFYMGGGRSYSVYLWVSGYFVQALPGIVCHLVMVPLLVMALMKARIIPVRYPKQRMTL